jgi:NADH-quinone oxidoreductase subunit M
MSALETHTGAGLAALFSMVLGAAYVLDSYRRAFFGPLGNDTVGRALDLRQRELMIVAIFGLLILLAGLCPSLILDTTREAGSLWVTRLGLP